MDFPPLVPRSGRLDDLADPIDVFEEVARRIAASDLRRRVSGLPEAERRVVVCRFGLLGDGGRAAEIDGRLGLRCGATQRLERRALELLRASYRADA